MRRHEPQPGTEAGWGTLRSAGAGAALLLAACLASWLGADLSYLGRSSPEAADLVATRYRGEYLLFAARILLVSLSFGGTAGAACHLALCCRCGRPPRRFAAPAAGALVLCLSALLLSRSLLLHPQLHGERLARWGWLALWQETLVAVCPPPLFTALLLLFFLAALCGLARRYGLPAAAALLAVVVLAAAASATAGRRHPGGGRGPNVLLVVIDSLRSDHVSALGHARPTTPSLDRLIAGSTTFPDSYVAIARTFPSLITLLTGRLPFRHGIRTMFPTFAERQVSGPTLPGFLKEHDYATGVVGDYAAEIFADVRLGFDRVDVPRFDFTTIFKQSLLERQTLLLAFLDNPLGRRLFPELAILPQYSLPAEVTRKAIAVAGRLPSPFFLTVFYSATHFPYTAAYPDYLRFTAPGYRGPFRWSASFPASASGLPTDADREQVRALYDGALLGADRALGDLLAWLEGAGLAGETIVIVTGDHGESLLEPGAGFGHGDHFWGGLRSYRVPLVIRAPGRPPEGVRREVDVRDVDLLPTIADLLGLAPPVAGDGISVFQPFPGVRPVYAETGLWMDPSSMAGREDMRLPYPDILGVAEVDARHGDEVVLKREFSDLTRTAKHRLYKEGRWVLLYLPTRAGVRYELYDAQSDPDLRRDVLAQHPETAASLRASLLRLLTQEPGVVVSNDYVTYPKP